MKAYVKPELFYERYELSKHIADCAFELNSNDPSTCSADVDSQKETGIPAGFTVFLSQSMCEFVKEEYCYFDGSESFNTFKS